MILRRRSWAAKWRRIRRWGIFNTCKMVGKDSIGEIEEDGFEVADGQAEGVEKVGDQVSAGAGVIVEVAETGGRVDALMAQVSPFENLDLSRIFDSLLEPGPKKTLEDFFAREVMPHAVAEEVITSMFKDELAGKELDVDKVLAAVAPGHFYSNNPAEEEVEETPGRRDRETPSERRERIKGAVVRAVARNFRWMELSTKVESFFFMAPDFGLEKGFSRETFADCPWTLLGLENFGVKESQLIEFVRYRLFFLKLFHRAMELFKEGKPSPGFQREAYTMAQIATKVTLDHCRRVNDATKENGFVPIPPKNRLVPAPSLKLFEKQDPQQPAEGSPVDDYIKATLSLIFPDKEKVAQLTDEEGNFANLAQEEFVIFDLIALANKFGLYEKYAPIFEAIFAYRRAQFMVNFHFNPEAVKNPGEKTATVIKVMKDFYDRQKEGQKKLPYVGNWGGGGGQMDRLLLQRGLVSGIFSVDVDDSAETDVVTEEMGGKYQWVKIGSKHLSEKELQDRINEYFPEVDVLLGCDVSHECSDPRKYIPMLVSKVRGKGAVYFTDPVHCKTVDRETRSTTYPFDNSRYPHSMYSLEQWFNVVGYLNVYGWKVEEIKVASGVEAGYNDPFYRGIFYLSGEEAGKIRPDVLCRMPKEESKGVKIEVAERKREELMNEVFQVWPLNFVPASERERIYAAVGGYLEMLWKDKRKGEGLGQEEIRRDVCRALKSHKKNLKKPSRQVLSSKNALNKDLRQPWINQLGYFDKVSRMFGPDENLQKMKHGVREATLLGRQLKSLFDVDISMASGIFF